MGAGILVVRAVGSEESCDDSLYATPSDQPNGLLIRAEDGPNAWQFPATAIEIEQWVGDKWKSVEYVRDVKATCYVTDSRFAVMCSKYDKGGGWIGGATALALNAGSMALAAHRRSGKCLTAQIRYAWVSAVGGSSKSGMLDDERLVLRFHLKVNGQPVELQMRLTLPKKVDSHACSAEIARRAAAYRLAAGEHLMKAADEGPLRGLASVASLTDVKGRFAVHSFPGSWPVGEPSADLAALVSRRLAAAGEGPSVPESAGLAVESPAAEDDAGATSGKNPSDQADGPTDNVPIGPLTSSDSTPAGPTSEGATESQDTTGTAAPGVSAESEPALPPEDSLPAAHADGIAPEIPSPVQGRASDAAAITAPRSRFCTSCGSPAGDGVYCTSCGRPLRHGSPAPAEVARPDASTQAGASPSPSSAAESGDEQPTQEVESALSEDGSAPVESAPTAQAGRRLVAVFSVLTLVLAGGTFAWYRMSADGVPSATAAAPTTATEERSVTTGPKGGEVLPQRLPTKLTLDVQEVVDLGSSARQIEADPVGPNLYITDPANDRVLVMDRTTRTITRELPTATGANSIDISPDGSKLAVAQGSASTVRVFDLDTDSFLDVAVGSRPGGLTVAPNGTEAFVCLTEEDAVARISLESGTVLAKLPSGSEPGSVRVTPDGSQLLVANSGDDSISVINVDSPELSTRIPVGPVPRGLQISENGQLAVTRNTGDNTVSLVNPIAGDEIGRVSVGPEPRTLEILPGNATVLVSDSTDGTISMIDVEAQEIVETASIGGTPAGTALDPAGGLLYVVITDPGSMAVVELSRQDQAGATLGTATSLEPDELLTGPIPPACEHAPGRLVDGELPGLAPNEGYVALARDDSSGKVLTVESDLVPGVSPELLGRIKCSQGGVGWPEVLVLYGPGPAVLGHLDLFGLGARAEHATVISLKPTKDAVEVVWNTYEGAGFDMDWWSGSLRFVGSELVMNDITATSDPNASDSP